MLKFSARIKTLGKGRYLGIIIVIITGLAFYFSIGKQIPRNNKILPQKNVPSKQRVLNFNSEINKYEIENKSFDIELPSSEEKTLTIKNSEKESIKLDFLDSQIDETEIDSKGNSIVYREAYEKTDIKYETLNRGIKESIILKETGHPKDFVFSIDLSPYDYILEPSGRLKIYKKGQKGEDLFLVFDIPAPYMIDANEKRSENIEVQLIENKIIITPNEEWLKNATYPIIIDPTVAINVLNIHSNPLEGDYWEVDFTTVGTDDLYIRPADQATIDDLEFAYLECGEIRVQPQILEDDVIFVPNWTCSDVGTVSHLVKKAGNHHLIFEFAGQTADAYNAAVTWDGGAGTSNWEDAANWSTDSIPTNADDVTIDSTVTVNINSSTTINSLTLGNSGGTTSPTLNFDYDAATLGALIIDDGDLTVNSGATITHTANGTTVTKTFYLDIQTGNATIIGTLNVNSKGYSASEGPGQGTDGDSRDGGAGAGYGGEGGNGESGYVGGSIYGDITNPTQPGSGGGGRSGATSGGLGGGYMKLSVAGTLTNSGVITANGGNGGGSCGDYSAGGGSGGGIYISTGIIEGTGTIRANGGNGYNCSNADGGGGSGGRIAILDYTDFTFSGTIVAQGGNGPDSAQHGGAGTIFKKAAAAANGDLIVDNGSISGSMETDSASSSTIPVTPFTDTYIYDNLTVQNYANLKNIGTITTTNLTIKEHGHLNNTTTGDLTYSNLTWQTSGMITDGGGAMPLITAGSDLVIPEDTVFIANTSRSFNTIEVNGSLRHSYNSSTFNYKVDLTTTGSLTIGATGVITTSGRGYSSSNGPGQADDGSSKSGGGGGGYGGNGGNGEAGISGGSSYGSITAPDQPGSGGGTGSSSGGAGGGYIKLDIGTTLTVDGAIYANGTNGGGACGDWAAGGGSGGGIYISMGSFAGTGILSANGGNGYDCSNADGGGGSGGRISLVNYSSDTFSGSIKARGGNGPGGAQHGAAGTIYKEASGTGGDLTLDNDVMTGAMEPNTASSDFIPKTTFADTYTYDSLTIDNYANADITGTLTATTINLQNSGHLNVQSTANISYTTFNWSTGGIVTDNGGTFDVISGAGDLIVPDGTHLIANTTRTFNSVTINGVLTHSYNSSVFNYQIDYTTVTDFTVGSSGQINIGGRGYSSSNGPGQGSDGEYKSGGGGGGYGGYGGNGEAGISGGSGYGSITAPDQPGSGGGTGGGSGGAGGGYVKLTVGNSLDISGVITADGTNGGSACGDWAAGGGSGGGIYISATTVAGIGEVRANGGNGYNCSNADGGGGSGGRIAFINFSDYTYSGTVKARGGWGPDSGQEGGAGTIFKKSSTDTNGHITLDNDIITGSMNANTASSNYIQKTAFDDTYTFDSITINNYAEADVTGTLTATTINLQNNGHLNVQSTANISYTNFNWTSNSILTDNGGTFDLLSAEGDLIVPDTTLLIANTTRTFNSVTVNGTITHSYNTSVFNYKVDYVTIGNFTVGSAGAVSVNGRGYSSSNGSGQGGDGEYKSGGGGGGYGGNGGNGEAGISGGDSYGSITEPDSPGSGGGTGGGSGGTGGGYVRLSISGTLDIGGIISANGTNGGSACNDWAAGGGSGGGIYISATTIAGIGEVRANGGSGANCGSADGGGGSGGRIAIDNYTTYSYSGTLSAQGGTGPDGAQEGAAGTIYTESSSQTNGNLTLDNGLITGDVEAPGIAFTVFDNTYAFDSVTLKNYANMTVSGTLNTNNLTIENYAHIRNQASADITYSNLTWRTNGAITDNGGSFTLLNTGTSLTIPVDTKLVANTERTFSEITVNGTLTHSYNSSIFTYGIYLNTTGDFTVNSSGQININSRGFTSSNGPGQGTDGNYKDGGGGGGYGGAGGHGGGSENHNYAGGSENETQDTFTQPGSGGGGYNGSSGGGSGGGFVKLTIDGTLDLKGLITANGGNGSASCNDYAAGGGSGGGIYITTKDIIGAGTIRANGGNGYNCGNAEGGGGGGGRIAIYYMGTYGFTGSYFVSGGSGPDRAENGYAGSYYTQAANNLPVATAPYSITQAIDGSGYITFNTMISDADGNDTKVKIEYSEDSGTSWYDAYIEAVVFSQGNATVNNSQEYQIGESDKIDTSGGTVILTITWDSKSGSNGGGSLEGTDQDDIKLKITANDDIGDGTPAESSAFSVDNLAPTGLSDLTITTLTDSTITFTWDTIAEEEFSHFEVWRAETSTDVEARNSSAIEWDDEDDSDLALEATTTTTVTDIDPEINYYWKLWAIDAYGNEGTTTTLLQTIANLGQFNPDCLVEKEVGEGLEGTSGCFQAQVADTDGSDNLYIEVEVKDIGTPLDGTSTVTSSPAVAYSGTPVDINVTQTGLTIGTDYHWRIRSRDDAGTTSTWISFGGNASGEIDFTAVVPSPTTVISTYVSDTEISISWDDPSDLEDGFILERSTNDGFFIEINTLPANTTNFTDNPANNPGSPPEADSKYIYAIKSTYNEFESTATTAEDPTYTTPAAPTNLTINQTGMGTITLTWTDNSGYEEYFQVQRKIGSGSFEIITSTVEPELETYPDTNVKEENSYQYRVFAIRTNPNEISSSHSESETNNVDIGGGKGIYITRTGRLIVQNNFKKEIDVWEKIQDDTNDQIGQEVVYDETNPANGPLFAEETTINDLYVKEGGSLVDGRSDVIYAATNSGIIAIHEKGLEPSQGAVKYYTNEYITDLMIGNIKAMWTLHNNTNSTTVTDTSANNNNLTASVNTSTISTSGVRGLGWELSGEYAYSTDNNDLDFAASDNFSINMWFKHASISTNPEYLIAKHQGGVSGGYKIWMDNDGDICFGIDDDGTWNPDDSACTENVDYDDNEWHQLTATKTGTSKIELFIDGDKVAEDTDLEATNTLENAAYFYLGIDSDGSSNSWEGSIDEVSITGITLTNDQIKIMYEIGNRARRNHTEGRITGVTGTDLYQQLLGAGTDGKTVNQVKTVEGDAAGQYIYVGTNDASGNTGGLAIIGVLSDSVVDLYTENNTTKVDDNSNQYTGNDLVAVSVIGIPTPDYRNSGDASGVGGIIAILSDNDTASRIWVEGQSYSLARTIAALTSSTGSSGGTQLEITNTQNPYFTNSELGLQNVFSIDTKGNIVHNYYGVDRDTTAIKFSDPVLTTGTTMQITGSALTTGILLDLNVDSLTTGNGLSLISSSENLAGSLADIQVTGTAATGNAMNLASSATGDSNKVLNIAQTGGTTGTDYGAYISNAGEGDTNVGLFVSATEGTNNYAAIFESGYIGIGTTTPTSLLTISGLESSTGTQVVVDASGNVYKDSSSRRYKENIEDFSVDPRELLGLKPVEFNYKDTGAHSFGYIAEEVDELGLTTIVMYDEQGHPESLRYDKLSIYLVEGYKQHEKELETIKKLLGLSEVEETTESSETSTSTSLAGVTKSMEEMLNIFEEFKNFTAALGLETDTNTESLLVNSNLNVIGETTLNDLNITGNLSAGLIEINTLYNAINIKGPSCYKASGDINLDLCNTQTLYFQKDRSGNVDIFDGKIVLLPNGNLLIEGTIEGKNIITETIQIKGTNQTIGQGIIPSGKTYITIETISAKPESKIFVTPNKDTQQQTLAVENKQEEEFTVVISNPLPYDLPFDWWIINIQE